MNANQVTKRSIPERIFHAILYEIVALLLCTPLFAWLMNTPLLQMGALNLMLSTLAMAWNVLFNAAWDAMLRRMAWQKTPRLRIAHGVAFECSLGLLAIPLAAWWLDISWWQALVLDGGLLLFFLPYTVAFNWTYDHARARWQARG
ncbi:multidrug/biocide efflux PACE transporter [Massilia sp. W12]|uniref:multidrug/biocide efflux PACE transporter n=1 Tax=Massilia sp. W12 TaxID=3126507 RepID=UPI0030D4B712